MKVLLIAEVPVVSTLLYTRYQSLKPTHKVGLLLVAKNEVQEGMLIRRSVPKWSVIWPARIGDKWRFSHLQNGSGR